jgi:adenylate cyclase
MSNETRRRLAAIVSADVVGYSRLIGADESGTLNALRGHRAELIDPLVAKHGGRIVKTMGDGLLLEFPSVVNAVKCSIDVQHGMAARNSGVPEGKRIELRIGINLGDIVIDGDDIHGDGVNVAARLQTASEAGGLALSGVSYESLGSLVDAAFEDGGQQQFKNIARPIQVWRWRPRAPSARVSPTTTDATLPLPDKPSIAVLPFDNISGDAEQEYFSDGLTEDLITALTHWRTFPVIARNSCFAYKNKAVDIKQVARELGAGYVLEGSVRKGGARVRITAQLIDGLHGHHLWAERYDRELDDIFAVQDDIVQRIAAVVAPELDKAELQRSTGKRPEDLAAWDLCLRAKQLLRGNSREANASARDLFLRVIALRPDYSDAHAGLAQSLNQDNIIGAADDRISAATRAMEAGMNAVRHDESSSWAHHELSTAYQLLNRTDDALAEARIAVKLNPYDAYALHALGNKSDLAGDPGGIGFMEKAQKLNPEDAQRHTHLTFLARAYVSAGDYDAAIERARQAIRRRPDYAAAHYMLAIASGLMGRLDEARASLKKCDELSPGFVGSRRGWRPYADEAKNEKLREALRAAES